MESSWRIAFDSRKNGVAEVYTASYDGTDIRRVTFTESPGFSCCPVWSPDHLKIAFISDRDGDEEIYLMNPDGNEVQRLTHHPGDDWSPTWHPNGTQIAFLSGPDPYADIFTVNNDGSGFRLLDERMGTASGDLVWSPDGTKFLFTSHRTDNRQRTHIFDFETGEVNEAFSVFESSITANASWSPSMEYFVFTSDRYGSLDIFRIGRESSNIMRLTNSPEGRIGSWALSQSPDGEQIVFSSDRKGDEQEWRSNVEIYIMDSGGSNVQRVTFNNWMDAHPSW